MADFTSSSPTSKSKDAIIAYAAEHAKLNRKIPRAKGAWRVIPNLYLGNAVAAGDAATLRQLKVTAVQSVGPRSEKVAIAGLRLMRVAIQDNDEAHILPFLEEACTWINAELAKEEGVVLVHCKGGMNRSATMVAAFLVWKFPGMTAAEAKAVVRQARPAARFGRGGRGPAAGSTAVGAGLRGGEGE